jgi:hypothetical protein
MQNTVLWICILQYPGFSVRNANQTFHAIIPSTKIIKVRAIKGNDKSSWRFLTSAPIIQKKKLKAKHTKNNLKQNGSQSAREQF